MTSREGATVSGALRAKALIADNVITTSCALSSVNEPVMIVCLSGVVWGVTFPSERDPSNRTRWSAKCAPCCWARNRADAAFLDFPSCSVRAMAKTAPIV